MKKASGQKERKLKKELLIKDCRTKGNRDSFLGFDKPIGNQVLSKREQKSILSYCEVVDLKDEIRGFEKIYHDYSELDELPLDELSLEEILRVSDMIAHYRSVEVVGESEDVVNILKGIIEGFLSGNFTRGGLAKC